MKFFQKRWVAITLCVLMILAAFGISGSKQDQTVYRPSDSDEAEEWGEDNYGSYTRYILDQADLFSDNTVRKLSEYNAGFDYAHGSICGVATVSSLDGQPIDDVAYDAAESIGLGGSDYLLLLDEETEDWYFVYGDDASYYVDNRLEILVTGAMDTVFTDTDDTMLALFDDLEDWYSDTVPPADADYNGDGMVVGGSFLFIALIVILILLALISSTIRAGRRLVGGWWPLFIGGNHRRTRFHHAPPPGPRPGPRPNSRPKTTHSSGRGRTGGFGGSSRGNFGRGGGFGGGSRGGGFGGKR